jgi:hypothetical protein
MGRSLPAGSLALAVLAGASAVLAGASVVLAGCSAPPSVSPPVRPAPAPTGNDGLAAVDEPPGTNTCHRLRVAIADATLMVPGVVDAIVKASRTADAPVADAAQRMAAAYAAAVTAKGSDSEPDAVAAVSAAGAAMSGVCDDSGLDTVG